MSPETRAALDRLHASGLIAEALAAFAMDHVYAVEMAHEHARAVRVAESAKGATCARAANRAARALQAA